MTYSACAQRWAKLPYQKKVAAEVATSAKARFGKYSEEPGGDETSPTLRLLQRPADEETAETKEDLDGEFSKVLAVARHRRLGTSRQVKMMAE